MQIHPTCASPTLWGPGALKIIWKRSLTLWSISVLSKEYGKFQPKFNNIQGSCTVCTCLFDLFYSHEKKDMSAFFIDSEVKDFSMLHLHFRSWTAGSPKPNTRQDANRILRGSHLLNIVSQKNKVQIWRNCKLWCLKSRLWGEQELDETLIYLSQCK